MRIVIPAMPELPEVETVRSGLEKRLVGEVFASLQVLHEGILEDCSGGSIEGLAGFRVERVDRKAKYLLLRLVREPETATLVVHLGMTGQLAWRAPGEPYSDKIRRFPSGYAKHLGAPAPDGHVHLRASTVSGGELLYRDPRRFGRIMLLRGGDESCPRLARLGPDAWRMDPSAMARRLREKAGRRPVKAVLLDQSVVAGIGNIYADEACHAALVRPSRKLSALSAKELAALAAAVDAVLEKGVRNAGTTFSDFHGVDGEAGSNQDDLHVYGRGGRECLTCGSDLRTATIAQRTTVWCPRCQR